MSDRIEMTVSLPTDKEGMLGRECPECEQYFKIKPGTGRGIDTCTCPYCEHTGHNDGFATEEQIEYAQSVAVREALGCLVEELQRSLKQLERATRHSLVSFKVETKRVDLPVKYYTEQELETIVECDSCGLVFAIFGVFGVCPDCARSLTMSMFRKSLEVAGKRLGVLGNVPPDETELIEALLVDTLNGGVATFDSLGKRLRAEFPAVFPEQPRNLFQNLNALSRAVERNLSVGLEELIGASAYANVHYLFHVRHIWTHNFGEVDDDFIRKTGCDPSLAGTRVAPTKQEVEEFLSSIEALGIALRNKAGEYASYGAQA